METGTKVGTGAATVRRGQQDGRVREPFSDRDQLIDRELGDYNPIPTWWPEGAAEGAAHPWEAVRRENKDLP